MNALGKYKSKAEPMVYGENDLDEEGMDYGEIEVKDEVEDHKVPSDANHRKDNQPLSQGPNM